MRAGVNSGTRERDRLFDSTPETVGIRWAAREGGGQSALGSLRGGKESTGDADGPIKVQSGGHITPNKPQPK